MQQKAFTLIEILLTIAIISLAMVGISTLTGTQVNRLRDKVNKEDFIARYNAVLLNAIGSSNVEGQGQKNTLVIYDGYVASTGLDGKPQGDGAYRVYRNGLPRNASIVFDNYSLGCSVNGQTGERVNFSLYADNQISLSEKQPLGCFVVDLSTCKLLEQQC